MTIRTPDRHLNSAAFALDKQFCRREMDHGVKTDIWSVMEDFSKGPGSGFQQAEVTVFSFCGCSGLKAGVSVCV